MSPTAVVILNFNGEKLLRQFLPSVLQFSGFAKIVVADNGSTDNSVHILREEFPSVELILLDKNYGFCGGYNRALQQVNAEYYVLLNSDVEVTQGWLTPMLNLLDQNPSIGAIQPKLLSYAQRTRFEYAGAGGGFIDTLGYPFCRGRIFDTVEEDQGQYNDERKIFWATGACLMIRAELYHKFNGFDEDFFAHMEEIDLCWKLHRHGAKVFYCGKSTVYHLGAGTLGYASPKKTYLNFRNGLQLITKHLNPGELIFKLPLRVILDWLAAVVYLFKGEGQHSRAILNAHVDFVKSFGKTLQKRRELRALYPDYPSSEIYHGSVLLGYFLLGKKTYPEVDQ
jgi:GT2 family glycosyltransferase